MAFYNLIVGTTGAAQRIGSLAGGAVCAWAENAASFLEAIPSLAVIVLWQGKPVQNANMLSAAYD